MSLFEMGLQVRTVLATVIGHRAPAHRASLLNLDALNASKKLGGNSTKAMRQLAYSRQQFDSVAAAGFDMPTMGLMTPPLTGETAHTVMKKLRTHKMMRIFHVGKPLEPYEVRDLVQRIELGAMDKDEEGWTKQAPAALPATGPMGNVAGMMIMSLAQSFALPQPQPSSTSTYTPSAATASTGPYIATPTAVANSTYPTTPPSTIATPVPPSSTPRSNPSTSLTIDTQASPTRPKASPTKPRRSPTKPRASATKTKTTTKAKSPAKTKAATETPTSAKPRKRSKVADDDYEGGNEPVVDT